MVKEYGVSVRNDCRSVRLPRSCYYTPAPLRDDTEVIAKIEEYIRENPRHGFDSIHDSDAGTQ